MAYSPSSGRKFLGTALQIVGMLMMFGGFIYLVMGIQSTVQSVTSAMSAEGGIARSGDTSNIPDPEDLTSQMNARVYQFIAMLGAGIFVMFLGLILKATDDGGMKNRVQLQRQRYGSFR